MKIDDLNLFEDSIDPELFIGTRTLHDPEDESNAMVAARGIVRASKGQLLTGPEKDAIKEYANLFVTMLSDPGLRLRLISMQNIAKAAKSKDNNPKDDSEKDKE